MLFRQIESFHRVTKSLPIKRIVQVARNNNLIDATWVKNEAVIIQIVHILFYQLYNLKQLDKSVTQDGRQKTN